MSLHESPYIHLHVPAWCVLVQRSVASLLVPCTSTVHAKCNGAVYLQTSATGCNVIEIDLGFGLEISWYEQ